MGCAAALSDIGLEAHGRSFLVFARTDPSGAAPQREHRSADVLNRSRSSHYLEVIVTRTGSPHATPRHSMLTTVTRDSSSKFPFMNRPTLRLQSCPDLPVKLSGKLFLLPPIPNTRYLDHCLLRFRRLVRSAFIVGLNEVEGTEQSTVMPVRCGSSRGGHVATCPATWRNCRVLCLHNSMGLRKGVRGVWVPVRLPKSSLFRALP